MVLIFVQSTNTAGQDNATHRNTTAVGGAQAKKSARKQPAASKKPAAVCASTPAETTRPSSELQETTSQRPQLRKYVAERFKTQMCRNFETTGSCNYGDRCMFAHGEQELRSAEMNTRDGITTQEAIETYRSASVSACSTPPPAELVADNRSDCSSRRTTPPPTASIAKRLSASQLSRRRGVVVSIDDHNATESVRQLDHNATNATTDVAQPGNVKESNFEDWGLHADAHSVSSAHSSQYIGSQSTTPPATPEFNRHLAVPQYYMQDPQQQHHHAGSSMHISQDFSNHTTTTVSDESWFASSGGNSPVASGGAIYRSPQESEYVSSYAAGKSSTAGAHSPYSYGSPYSGSANHSSVPTPRHYDAHQAYTAQQYAPSAYYTTDATYGYAYQQQ